MEIEELFDELEDLSDSGPELDTMSVSSTPKPSLRPFFSSSRSLLTPPHSGKTRHVFNFIFSLLSPFISSIPPSFPLPPLLRPNPVGGSHLSKH